VISEFHWARLDSHTAISRLQKFILIHSSPMDFPAFVLNLGHCLSLERLSAKSQVVQFPLFLMSSLLACLITINLILAHPIFRDVIHSLIMNDWTRDKADSRLRCQ
jgi:hypothetical protein